MYILSQHSNSESQLLLTTAQGETFSQAAILFAQEGTKIIWLVPHASNYHVSSINTLGVLKASVTKRIVNKGTIPNELVYFSYLAQISFKYPLCSYFVQAFAFCNENGILFAPSTQYLYITYDLIRMCSKAVVSFHKSWFPAVRCNRIRCQKKSS